MNIYGAIHNSFNEVLPAMQRHFSSFQESSGGGGEGRKLSTICKAEYFNKFIHNLHTPKRTLVSWCEHCLLFGFLVYSFNLSVCYLFVTAVAAILSSHKFIKVIH